VSTEEKAPEEPKPTSRGKRWSARTWAGLATGAFITVFLGGLVVALADRPAAVAYVDVVHAFLSWPVIIGTVAVTFLLVFRAEVSQVVRGFTALAFKFPGGEFSVQQGQQAPTEEAVVPPETTGEIDWEANAIYWFYRFLDIFLVPRTKQILRWFANSLGANKDLYELTWGPVVGNPLQLSVILNVLLENQLLAQDGPLLKVTPLGGRFLGYLNEQVAASSGQSVAPEAPPESATDAEPS
jgi:hypothetical protein